MNKISTLIAFSVLLLVPVGAQNAFATTLDFPDFSSTAGLTVNGDAAGNVNNGIDPNPVLRLAQASAGQAGSAFSDTTINSADFRTMFQFRITEAGGANDGAETGADGFTFVVQPVSSASLGIGGGSLAYSPISPSVAVEFDTWRNGFDPDTNHIGVDQDGSVTSLVTTIGYPGNGLPKFDDGTLYSAWIDYDGTTLDIFISSTAVKPATPVLSHVIDIPAIIGANDAFVGFTGSTGGAIGNHDIVNWNYVDTINQEPEPVVGGEFLDIDSTALLLSVAQSPAWLTSLTIAALGISAYVFTRNPSNLRNIKAILKYYLDRF